MWPNEAATISQDGSLSKSEESHIAEVPKALLAKLWFGAVLWAPSHYTCILATRATLGEAWAVQYFDRSRAVTSFVTKQRVAS